MQIFSESQLKVVADHKDINDIDISGLCLKFENPEEVELLIAKLSYLLARKPDDNALGVIWEGELYKGELYEGKPFSTILKTATSQAGVVAGLAEIIRAAKEK